MNNFQIGDIVTLCANKNLYGFTTPVDNFYGIITKLRKHHYDDDKFYYTVLWFNTGDSHRYVLEELIKVNGNEEQLSDR